MGMYDEKVVLCGANSYEEKYYLNPDFEQLPDDVKNELKIMCVLYVHDVGGILTLVFEENGELCFEVTSDDFDPMFDDIAAIIGGVPGALDTPVALYETVEEGTRVTAGYVYKGEAREGFDIVEIPAADAAICGVHLGSMDRIGNSWQALHTDLLARGYVPSAACRELYVRSYPEDQTDWVTELQQPVELP